jgi:hypothetical protein
MDPEFVAAEGIPDESGCVLRHARSRRRPVTVVEVGDAQVTIDGNHPLGHWPATGCSFLRRCSAPDNQPHRLDLTKS